MPVIKMNVPCTLETVSGYDAFGQPKKTEAKKTVCAVVKLEKTMTQSTVRADSASSRGHSEENRGELVVLMRANESVALNDTITVYNTRFRVHGIRPRYTVLGKVDHLEIMGEIA